MNPGRAEVGPEKCDAEANTYFEDVIKIKTCQHDSAKVFKHSPPDRTQVCIIIVLFVCCCFLFLEHLVVYFFGQASSLLPVGFAFHAVKLTYYESEEVEKCAPVDRF